MFRPLTKGDKTKERMLTMDNMLGITLGEVRGPFKDLNDKLCSEEGKKWLEALKLFLRGCPVWAENMIYIPLEWSCDLGEVCLSSLEDYRSSYNKKHGDGWRLPTDKELRRALLKMKPEGFVLWKYYWTSTPRLDNRGFETIYTHDGIGGLGHSSSLDSSRDQFSPHLRLCRPIKLPE